jgi:hypothetical protein
MGKKSRVLPFARPSSRGKAEPAVRPLQASPAPDPPAAGSQPPGPPAGPLPRRVSGIGRPTPGNGQARRDPGPAAQPPVSPASLSARADPDRVIEPETPSPEAPVARATEPGALGEQAPGQQATEPQAPRPDPPGKIVTGAAAARTGSQARPRSEPAELRPEPQDEPVTGPIVLRPAPGIERQVGRPLAWPADAEVLPSWGSVVRTTVRLWAVRRWRRWRIAAVLVVALILFAGGGLTVALLRRGGSGSEAAGGSGGSASGAAGLAAVQAAAAARQQAATWIAAQVSHSAVVSCDPAMCADLQARGFPAGDLMTLGPGTSDPLGSAVIVATAAVRSLFGSRLTTVYAPTLIASFGAGSAQVDVRSYAAGGAAAYLAALRADEQSRRSVGTQLLHNPRVAAAPAARQQLATGQVDSRLLITIATLTGQGPVSIVAFGDSGPGASQGAPLREAELVSPPRAKSGYLQSVVALLRAQQQPYLANSVTLVRLAGGQQAVRIEFAAPSPLGLLSG